MRALGAERRGQQIPWVILHTYRTICPPARSHFMRVCAPPRVRIRSLFGSMDGGGLTDAESKVAYRARVQAICRTKHAQKVAKKFAKVFRKVCEEVVAKQGAASRM